MVAAHPRHSLLLLDIVLAHSPICSSLSTGYVVLVALGASAVAGACAYHTVYGVTRQSSRDTGHKAL